MNRAYFWYLFILFTLGCISFRYQGDDGFYAEFIGWPEKVTDWWTKKCS